MGQHAAWGQGNGPPVLPRHLAQAGLGSIWPAVEEGVDLDVRGGLIPRNRLQVALVVT